MWQTVQVSFLASLVLVWTSATIALVLRITARRMTDVWLWLDDYFCLAAYVCVSAVGFTGNQTLPLIYT